VSKSMLWDFDQSPWKWIHSGTKETTPAMEFGSLVHKKRYHDSLREENGTS